METYVRIKLKSGSSSILKTGFILRAVFIGAFVFGAAALGISMWHESLILALLCFAISFALILVVYRMLGAAFQSEEVLVNEHELIIVQKGVNVNTDQIIHVNAIRRIGFSETKYTANAMDNKIIDFTGLGAQEREMQFVIDEGNILIETDEESYRFGKKLPSWEVEDFIEQVEEITGKKFDRIPLKEEETQSTFIEQEEDDVTSEESSTT